MVLEINDTNWQTDAVVPPGQAMGLVPRDFRQYPVGYMMYAKPFDLPLLTDQQIEEGIKRQADEKSSLMDLRDKADNGSQMRSYDQNGQGYCWAYSSTCAASLVRVRDGQPYARLSAHKVGCLVKGYRDQGGWNSQSIEHIATFGVPSEEFWPAKSMARTNDTPAMRENAELHKITEWMDLDDGGDSLKRQIATALLANMPIAVDFNWWGHSVCAVKMVSWNPFKFYIWNSWTDSWGEKGMGILADSKAIPNGAIACRTTRAAVAAVGTETDPCA
jgi:hypothetical protein